MKHRTPLRRMLAVVSLAGVALALLLISQSPNQPSLRSPHTTKATVPQTTQEVAQAAANYDLPVRIKIPKINVDAPIEQTGLTPEGDMQAPSDPHHVGWYKFGSRPGNTGSGVIAGHYGPGRDGQASVFDALHTLNKGDHIYVEDEKGTTATFVVQEFQTYEQNEAAPNVFGSSDGKAHLNLITCRGDWDGTQQTYTNRLVVFSNKE